MYAITEIDFEFVLEWWKDSINIQFQYSSANSGWMTPFVRISDIPQSICDEMRINASKILNEKGSIASAPAGCSIYFISKI